MFLHLSVILFRGGMRGGGGHVWWWGMCGRGACVAGGMHGRGGLHGRGGMHFGGWQGVCVAGGHARQEIWPLQRTVRILLECILVKLVFSLD